MINRKKIVQLGFFWVFLLMTLRAEAFIMINEFLADPPSDISGDANGDGIRSSMQDEFIELYNGGSESVDLGGWRISDASSVRHIFADGTLLVPARFLVVFGGGDSGLSGISIQTASTGTLSLNNSGDRILLANFQGEIIDEVIYGEEAGHDQSLTRTRDGDRATGWVAHSEHILSEGRIYSPGTQVDGNLAVGEESDPGSQYAAVPEPATLGLFGLGSVLLAFRRRSDQRQ